MRINLIHGDCLEVMKDIPDNSIDCVLTDCPYKLVSGGCRPSIKSMSGIFNPVDGLTKSGKMFKYNEIDFSEWLPAVYRILKNATHCYIMINGRNLSKLQIESEKAGFKFQNLLVWEKNNVTPSRYYMQKCEYILMLRKGPAKTIINKGDPNIFHVPNILGNKYHPSEKPVPLMEGMISNSSKDGDIICDPFMGSGSCGVAAKNLNRNFIGIEKEKKYYDISISRIYGDIFL